MVCSPGKERCAPLAKTGLADGQEWRAPQRVVCSLGKMTKNGVLPGKEWCAPLAKNAALPWQNDRDVGLPWQMTKNGVRPLADGKGRIEELTCPCWERQAKSRAFVKTQPVKRAFAKTRAVKGAREQGIAV